MRERKATVYVKKVPAALLTEHEQPGPQRYEMKYLPAYLSQEIRPPISLRLPPRPEPYYAERLFPVFQNMLPEVCISSLPAMCLSWIRMIFSACNRRCNRSGNPVVMKPLFTEYTRSELEALFDGESVSPLLPYRYKAKGEAGDMPLESAGLSVSGAQPKVGMLVKAGKLNIAGEGEAVGIQIHHAW